MSLTQTIPKLFDLYNDQQWLSSDPVQFVHRYQNPQDQEIAGFLSASFAYGSASLVIRAAHQILEPMGESPAQFILKNKKRNWSGFYYRFHTERHLHVLIDLLQIVLKEYGSLSQFFQSKGKTAEDILSGVAEWFQINSKKIIEKKGEPELWRGLRFFFNSPKTNSACKRMLMFLKWMVRKDNIDIGIWNWFSPSELIIPVDTHIGRISYYLSLRGGKENQAATWKMAKEITASLSKYSPKDPVQYDFALSRLGILKICKRKYERSICERCIVEPACRFSSTSNREI